MKSIKTTIALIIVIMVSILAKLNILGNLNIAISSLSHEINIKL